MIERKDSIKHVSLFMAGIRFARLVQRASQGETILITRWGKPVARLTPLDQKPMGRMSTEQVPANFREIRSRNVPTDHQTIREMIDEGRRY